MTYPVNRIPFMRVMCLTRLPTFMVLISSRAELNSLTFEYSQATAIVNLFASTSNATAVISARYFSLLDCEFPSPNFFEPFTFTKLGVA